MATASCAPEKAFVWERVLELRCELRVEIPIPGFRVRNLLQLAKGAIIGTQWCLSTEVPLSANGQLIAWTEFEVAGENLAVRVTELA